MARPPKVDDAGRGVIERVGYGDRFVHRTGHPIGKAVHGNGANLNNLEIRNSRQAESGTCSAGPGIHLDDFGVRGEVSVSVEEHDKRRTGKIQQQAVPSWAGDESFVLQQFC